MPIFHRLAPAPSRLYYYFPPLTDPTNRRILWWNQRQGSSVTKPSSETCQAVLRYNRQHHHRTHSLWDAGRKYTEITDPKPSPRSELISFLCILNIYSREWRSDCFSHCPLAQLQHSQATSWRAVSLPAALPLLLRAPAGSQGHLRAVTDPHKTYLLQPLKSEQALTPWCLR